MISVEMLVYCTIVIVCLIVIALLIARTTSNWKYNLVASRCMNLDQIYINDYSLEYLSSESNTYRLATEFYGTTSEMSHSCFLGLALQDLGIRNIRIYASRICNIDFVLLRGTPSSEFTITTKYPLVCNNSERLQTTTVSGKTDLLLSSEYFSLPDYAPITHLRRRGQEFASVVYGTTYYVNSASMTHLQSECKRIGINTSNIDCERLLLIATASCANYALVPYAGPNDSLVLAWRYSNYKLGFNAMRYVYMRYSTASNGIYTPGYSYLGNHKVSYNASTGFKLQPLNRDNNSDYAMLYISY